jgi:hypothetical protein
VSQPHAPEVALAYQEGVMELSTSLFNVYPNPTDGQLNVNLPEEKGIFELLDLSGRTLFQYENNGQKLTEIFDVSDYPSGVYIARFTSATEIQSQSLVVGN